MHDFLYCYAGAEHVLEQMLKVLPHCDLYSLFDFVPEGQRDFLQGKRVKTSFIEKLPLASSKHRHYLPLMPMAVEQLDVSAYDIVISNSYVAAKGILTGPDQLHISYCHSPVRFAWDLQHQYLNAAGLGKLSAKSLITRLILHYIRTWDVRTSHGVDKFIANSDFIARRIDKVYRRRAEVCYPPVAVERFDLNPHKEDFYLAVSRLVPYKRMDLIAQAFAKMPDKRLIMIGDGPDMKLIRQIDAPNVRVMGYQPFDVLKRNMQFAKALVFAAEEDFGITPVEAMACGTPVIAYGKGGVLETVKHGKSGLFYHAQTPEAVANAVEAFEARGVGYDAAGVRESVNGFSRERFRKQFRNIVQRSWNNFTRSKLKHLDASNLEIEYVPVQTKPYADVASPALKIHGQDDD